MHMGANIDSWSAYIHIMHVHVCTYREIMTTNLDMIACLSDADGISRVGSIPVGLGASSETRISPTDHAHCVHCAPN